MPRDSKSPALLDIGTTSILTLMVDAIKISKFETEPYLDHKGHKELCQEDKMRVDRVSSTYSTWPSP